MLTAKPKNMSRIETFEIRAAYRRRFDYLVGLTGLCVLLFLVLPFQVRLSDDPGERAMQKGASVLAALAIAGFGLYVGRSKRHLAAESISIDPEGIWLTHRARDTSFVPWSQIAQVKERTELQRLDLLDDSGRTLLRVNYHLDRFLFLRDLILTRAALKLPKDRCFKRGWIYHAVNIAAFALFLGLGLASEDWRSGSTLALIGFMMFLQAYLRVVCRIEIHKNHLVVGWPVGSRIVRRGEISAIKMEDGQRQGSRWYFVEIYLNGAKKPLKLEALKDQTMQLRSALKYWRVHSV